METKLDPRLAMQVAPIDARVVTMLESELLRLLAERDRLRQHVTELQHDCTRHEQEARDARVTIARLSNPQKFILFLEASKVEKEEMLLIAIKDSIKTTGRLQLKFTHIEALMSVPEGGRTGDGRAISRVIGNALQRLRRRGYLSYDPEMGWYIPATPEPKKRTKEENQRREPMATFDLCPQELETLMTD